jgi:acyl transferase domain-containing protein
MNVNTGCSSELLNVHKEINSLVLNYCDVVHHNSTSGVASHAIQVHYEYSHYCILTEDQQS